jgi:hypothetical protein
MTRAGTRLSIGSATRQGEGVVMTVNAGHSRLRSRNAPACL